MSVVESPSSGAAPLATPDPLSPPTPPDVVTRPTLAQLLTLAGPVIVSRLAQVVIGFTDAVMCARLGESALAAATAGATNSFNVLILPMGTVFIVSSFASQLIGANDHAGARRFAWYGLAVAVVAGLLCGLAWPFVDDGVAQFDYAPDVQALMGEYIRYRLIGGFFAIGLEALGNYYNGLGNTRIPMFAQLFAMVLNVALNWVLIFGNLGAPALGVTGAAVASTLATALAFFALFAVFVAGVGQKVTTTTRLRLDELWRTFRFGAPVGANWFVEFAAFSFFMNVVLAGLGTTVVAAMMSVLQLNSLSFMPAFAIASAGSIFVGQAIGAKKHDDVPYIVKLTLGTAATWQGVVGLFYIAIPTVLMSAFVKDEQASALLLETGARLLMLSAAWQLFDAASMTFAEALRAAGDTSFTFWCRAAIAWLVFAPGAWVSVRVFDLGDVVAAGWLVIYLAMLAVVLILRFRAGKWRHVDLTGGAPPGH